MIVFYIIFIAVFIGLIFSYFNLFMLLGTEIRKRKLDKYPTVSIIVPAYNEEKNIEETINSLIELDYPKDKLEIIIVDDGSTDNTFEIAKKFEEKYDFIKVYKKENGGKASAINYGIKKSKGEYIVILDADSIVPKHALKTMLEYFTEDDVMIVVPAIQVKRKKTFVEKIQYIEYSYNNTLREIFEKMNSIYVAPGPFSIFRRKLFDIIGLFDENNLTEDMEIAMRTQNHGFKIRFCPEVIIKTEAPDTFKKLIRQRIRWYLGFLENYTKYRNINNVSLREIVFASAWIFILLPIALTIINIYFTLRGYFKMLEYYKSIDFDIIPEIIYTIQNFNLDFSVIRLTYTAGSLWLTILGIVMIIIFLILIRFSWKYEKEKDIFSLIIYSSVYSFLYSIFWIVVLYYKLFGKEIKWGGIVWNNSLINKLRNKYPLN